MSERVAACVALAVAVVLWPRPGPRPRPGALGLRRPAGRRAARPWSTPRRRRDHERALADTVTLLDLLRAALHAGVAPARAVALANAQLPAESPVRRAVEQAGRGDGIPQWAWVARATGVTGFEVVGQAWALSEEGGVPLTTVLDTTTDLVRAEADRAARTSVALAGPRATVRLLTALPSGGVLIAASFGIDPVRLYTASPASGWCLGIGIVAAGLGWAWAARLVRQVAG